MMIVADLANRTSHHRLLRAMFEARKQVFVDLLKWELPVLAGRFEVDQFDDINATYLIVTNASEAHLASVRLLDTVRPSLIDTLLPSFAARGLPRGPDVREITRFCLAPRIGAEQRRAARDRLLIGLAEHALAQNIRCYTGVAELGWFRQIRTFGWRCTALGPPQHFAGRDLVGLRIDIDAATPARMAAAGIAAGAAMHRDEAA